MFKHLLTFAMLAALLPAIPAAAHVSGSGGSGSSGSGGSGSAVAPRQLKPYPRRIPPPFIRGVYQPVKMPIPVIMKGKDPETRLKQMSDAVGHMMASVDPDLKSPAGEAPSAYERADRLRDKLSAADDVLRALETRARLEGAAGDQPTEAEIEQATQMLRAAADDLSDDVPAVVAAAVLHNPRRTLMYWVVGLLAAGGFAVGLVIRSRRPAAVSSQSR